MEKYKYYICKMCYPNCVQKVLEKRDIDNCGFGEKMNFKETTIENYLNELKYG